MTTTTTSTPTQTPARWLGVVKIVGLVCGLALPVLGFLGTGLALAAAVVLASRGRRKDAFLVVGVALGVLLVVLVPGYPVHSSGVQVTQH